MSVPTTPVDPNKTKKGGLFVGIALAGAFLVSAVTQHEGTRLKPYQDQGGVWTVCQGHTGKDVIPGKSYTTAECKALLTKDLAIAGKGVISCVKVPITQNQYDAFADLAFNIGTGAFCRSSIVRQLNAKNYKEACAAILPFNKVNKQFNQGLANRRQDEYKECVKPGAYV